MKQIFIEKSLHDFIIASMRKTCSQIIVSYGTDGHILHILGNGKHIGAFQVKSHWKEPAKMELIQEATDWWTEFAQKTEQVAMQISMNFPGIGAGGLSEGIVMPVISQLPNNVTVCMLGSR